MDTIIVENKSNVRIIKFNKQKKKNALDCAMYTEITKLLNEAASDENVSVVVFTGTGDYYSSGNDIRPQNNNHKHILLKAIEDFVNAIILFPKICIAIVNGPAIGIAVTTLPLFDFVYASENAYFYTPFSKLGIIAEACSSVTFPHIMGDKMARQMLMLNYKMSAKEALQYGLVSHVYKPNELHSKAWESIDGILKLPQHSLITTKMLLRKPYIEQLVSVNKNEIEELKKINEMVEKMCKL